MIPPLARLVWNRRRFNLLIGIEVLLSFLVLAAVVTTSVHLANNYRQPLGFEYGDVWSVRVTMPVPDGPDADSPPELTPEARRRRVDALVRLVRSLPEVVSVATVNDAPYSHSGWGSSITIGGRRFSYSANRASDEFPAVMRLTITSGRWFGPMDDGAAWEPVVLNERLAAAIFGTQDPVGRMLRPDPIRDQRRTPSLVMRVVGVIRDFRKDGEFSVPENWLFHRGAPGSVALGPSVPRFLVVRATPGSAGAFESRLVGLLNSSAPDMSFRARPLVLARAAVLREDAPALAAGGLVAFFLLVMVALGLTGVLWLTVTQRAREIGLRRAAGATGVGIRRQVLGEVLVVTTVAVILGVVALAQFPLLDVFGTVPAGVYAAGAAISIVCIYALGAACAWMPGRMASAIPPAEALRYE
jgi:putative ABC transport system permease protein